MKHFGRELYKIIEDRHLVKRQIAEKCGLNPAYFSQLMNRDSFDPATLEKICFAIGISPGYFFDDWPEGKMNIRDITQQNVIGNNTVNVGESVESLEKLLAEKERLIKVLLKQAGLSESVDGM